MEKIKWFVAMLSGYMATWFKAYRPIFFAVMFMLVFDWVTGIISAKVTGEKWNSETARKGVIKKGVMLLQLLFGIALDYIIPMAAEQIGFEFNVSHLLFSSIIGFYIIFTEAVSVCENFYECNPDSFPKWIIKFLSIGKDQLDKLGEAVEKESGVK